MDGASKFLFNCKRLHLSVLYNAMNITFITLSFAIALVGTGLGEDSAAKAPEMTPEMAAIIAGDRAYEEAHAKADVEALAAHFTEDAEYTSDDGRSFSGSAAIKACLRDGFRANKGSKISIHVNSVKQLALGVLVEKGTTTVVSKTGDEVQSLFTAVRVKKDDKWKISQLIETPMPEITPTERLVELSWLIGYWEETDKEAGLSIRSKYDWARGGNFITRNVTVKRGDDPVLEGWQIIGWDPVEESIRSWTFDDAGGHSGGYWTREGQRWLARETGYAPDGSRTSADQTISKTNNNKFYWESENRTLDGDPQPAIGRIEIQRVKGE
jgi:uncharacterized protein (TIGR02246 family)